jgi:hypothetical protein
MSPFQGWNISDIQHRALPCAGECWTFSPNSATGNKNAESAESAVYTSPMATPWGKKSVNQLINK